MCEGQPASVGLAPNNNFFITPCFMATAPTSLRLFQKVKAQKLTIATEAILKSTIQFYGYDKKKRLGGCGSGILLTVDDRFFVVSAAHVIQGESRNTFVLLGEYEVTLAGNWCYTRSTTIDLAVLELNDSPQIAELQQQYRFLTLADLSVRQKHLNDLYLVVGYPAAKTKVYGGLAHARAYPLQAQEAAGFDFAAHQLQRGSHLVLDATGNVVSASNPNPHKRPKLEGISGGGVWHNGNYLKDNPAEAKKLVGIITEESGGGRGRQRRLFVTRTAVLLEFMRLAFSLPSIPVSTTIKAKTRSQPRTAEAV